MAFPTYRLPPEVEVGLVGGPTINNVVQESISGEETRVRVWAKCKGQWEFNYPILNAGDTTGTFRAVIAMFRAHEDLYPFPFKDWSDYELTAEEIGTGDGSETDFQIIKTYDPSQILLGTPGSRTYVREIYLPRSGLVVKVNGVTKTITTDYTISSTGLIAFTSAPANGHAITVTGEFDTPVRFGMKRLDLTVNEASIVQINSLVVAEVIGTREFLL